MRVLWGNALSTKGFLTFGGRWGNSSGENKHLIFLFGSFDVSHAAGYCLRRIYIEDGSLAWRWMSAPSGCKGTSLGNRVYRRTLHWIVGGGDGC